MARTYYRLWLPLLFPHGVSPGEERHGNHLTMARDGLNRCVLRGTALAGALRHAWINNAHTEKEAHHWFGQALDGLRGKPSRLRVPDSPLRTTDNDQALDQLVRTHIAMDRHRGAVVDKGLFSLECTPPGARADVALWLDGGEDAQEIARSRAFLLELVALLDQGLTLGGHAARGIGLVKLKQPPCLRTFDCANLDQHAAMLDEKHAWRHDRMPTDGEQIAPDTVSRNLRISCILTIPLGEDLLLGDGQGLDYEMEPQRVRCADKHERWRLPGSSLRGILRAWTVRLAARAGYLVDDSVARHEERMTTKCALRGEDLAFGFDLNRKEIQHTLSKAPEKLKELVPCPVMRLFGSGYAKGRIHIADALSEKDIDSHTKPRDRQNRMHVAVDRVTGSANEGFLFDNEVLTGAVRFPVHIVIQEPSLEEAQWIACGLRALDVGILRVGSSKAAGRLRMATAPEAVGPHAEVFKTIHHV